LAVAKSHVAHVSFKKHEAIRKIVENINVKRKIIRFLQTLLVVAVTHVAVVPATADDFIEKLIAGDLPHILNLDAPPFVAGPVYDIHTQHTAFSKGEGDKKRWGLLDPSGRQIIPQVYERFSYVSLIANIITLTVRR